MSSGEAIGRLWFNIMFKNDTMSFTDFITINNNNNSPFQIPTVRTKEAHIWTTVNQWLYRQKITRKNTAMVNIVDGYLVSKTIRSLSSHLTIQNWIGRIFCS